MMVGLGRESGRSFPFGRPLEVGSLMSGMGFSVEHAAEASLSSQRGGALLIELDR